MDIRYETVMVETPKQKLLKNRTVQWFLYGDPDFLNKKVMQAIEKFNEDIEARVSNTLLFGTSHPEIFNQDIGLSHDYTT